MASYYEMQGGSRQSSALPRDWQEFLSGSFTPLEPMHPMAIDNARPGEQYPEPRAWNFPVGWNMPMGQPGSEGLKLAPFELLRSYGDTYSVARAAIQVRKEEILGLDWDIVPLGQAEKAMESDDDAHADFQDRRQLLMTFFNKPDGDFHDYQTWLGALLEEIFVTDAACIYLCPPTIEGKGLFGSNLAELSVIDGTTIRPIINIHGRTPRPPNVAYQQYLYGVPRVDLLTAILGEDLDENDVPVEEYAGSQLLYMPYIRRRWTPYGFCFSADTDVLTRRGWLKFAELNDADEVATRSPEGQFEWQLPTARYDDLYDGDMLHFRSQVFDLMVTPHHDLVARRRARPDRVVDGIYEKIPAHFFADKPGRTYVWEMPLTSQWDGHDPHYVVIPAAERKSGRHHPAPELKLPSELWAQFLGWYISEGYTGTGEQANQIYICQMPTSRHIDTIKEMVTAMGVNWYQDAKGIRFNHGPLAQWLRDNCYDSEDEHRAWTKRIPVEIKDYTSDLLLTLFTAMMAGDGHIEKTGLRRLGTTSPTLAGDTVEILQKAGLQGWIDVLSLPVPRDDGYNIVSKHTSYRITARPGEASRVPKPDVVHYRGSIHCVTVPNGVIYTRRNGRPAWSGNSGVERGLVPITTGLARQQWQLQFFQEGTLPGIFVTPGEDVSTPQQMRVLQDALNALSGDTAWKNRVIVLPPGSNVLPIKDISLSDPFDDTVCQQVLMAFEIMPSELGLTLGNTEGFVGGQATVAQQSEVINQRKALKPLLQWLKRTIFDPVIQKAFGQADLEWAWVGMEQGEDQGQKTDIMIKQIGMALLSVDEARSSLGMSPWGTPETSEPVFMTSSGPIPAEQIGQAAAQGFNPDGSGGPQAAPGPPGKSAPPPGGQGGPGKAQAAKPAAGASTKPASGKPAPSPGKPKTTANAAAKKPGKPITTAVGKPKPGAKPAVKKSDSASSLMAALQEIDDVRRHLKKGRGLESWEPRDVDPKVWATMVASPDPIAAGRRIIKQEMKNNRRNETIDPLIWGVGAGLGNLSRRLNQGQISVPGFVDESTALMEGGYQQAYAAGEAHAIDDGGQMAVPEDNPDWDELAAQRAGAVAAGPDDQGQRGFLDRLATVILNTGDLGQLGSRLALYAGNLVSAYEEAFGTTKANGVGDDKDHPGYKIIWHTEDDKACELCDPRDDEEYTLDTLPGWPGSGGFGELCDGGAQCRCSLEWVDNSTGGAPGTGDEKPPVDDLGEGDEDIVPIAPVLPTIPANVYVNPFRQSALERIRAGKVNAKAIRDKAAADRAAFVGRLPTTPTVGGMSAQARARLRDKIRHDLAIEQKVAPERVTAIDVRRRMEQLGHGNLLPPLPGRYANKLQKYDEDQPRDDDGKFVTLYHGTTQAAAEKIATEGFKASDPHGVANEIEARYGLPHDSVWLSKYNEFSRGRANDPHIYLTDDRDTASRYADIGSEVVEDSLSAAYIEKFKPFDSEGDYRPGMSGEARQEWIRAETTAHYQPHVMEVKVPWSVFAAAHEQQWSRAPAQPGKGSYDWYMGLTDGKTGTVMIPATMLTPDMVVKPEANKYLKKYDEDQPRDDDGRFAGSTNGGARPFARNQSGELTNEAPQPPYVPDSNASVKGEFKADANGDMHWSQQHDALVCDALAQWKGSNIMLFDREDDDRIRSSGSGKQMMAWADALKYEMAHNSQPIERQLYRGIGVKSDDALLLAKEGDVITLRIQGFSSNQKTANGFAGHTGTDIRGTPRIGVKFIVDKGASGLRIQSYLGAGGLDQQEQEYLLQGKFQVTHVLPGAGPGYQIRLRQLPDAVEKYDDSEARDDAGKWTAGGDSSAPPDSKPDSDKAAAQADVAALAAGKPADCPPPPLDVILDTIVEGGKPVDLHNLTVLGEGNENLFTHSSLGLRRDQMPVIPASAADVAKFAAALEAADVTSHLETVDPRSLKATQNQLDGLKVAGILGRLEAAGQEPIPDKQVLVVAKDGSILDGHHRWAANAAYAAEHPDHKVTILRTSCDIESLVGLGRQFDQLQGIGTNAFGAKGEKYHPNEVPPHRDQPWMLVDGKWVLLATDDADGVPRRLDFPKAEPVEKYSPDQERDDRGRFGSGTSDDSKVADAIAASPEGFSVHPYRGSTPTTGYMVAIGGEAHVHVFDAAVLHDQKALTTAIKTMRSDNQHLFSPGGKVYIGGWSEGGKLYLEPAERVSSRAEAVAAGKMRDQIAIWDVAAGAAINTGGTGAGQAAGVIHDHTTGTKSLSGIPRGLRLVERGGTDGGLRGDGSRDTEAVEESLTKYDENQERDASGKWTSGGQAWQGMEGGRVVGFPDSLDQPTWSWTDEKDPAARCEQMWQGSFEGNDTVQAAMEKNGHLTVDDITKLATTAGSFVRQSTTPEGYKAWLGEIVQGKYKVDDLVADANKSAVYLINNVSKSGTSTTNLWRSISAPAGSFKVGQRVSFEPQSFSPSITNVAITTLGADDARAQGTLPPSSLGSVNVILKIEAGGARNAFPLNRGGMRGYETITGGRFKVTDISLRKMTEIVTLRELPKRPRLP